MTIGILKNGTVVNSALFADLQTAQAFLSAGVWADADNVLELLEGYGIGDSYDGENWIKAPTVPPEEPEPAETPLNTEEYILDLDYRLTLMEITNGGNIE